MLEDEQTYWRAIAWKTLTQTYTLHTPSTTHVSTENGKGKRKGYTRICMCVRLRTYTYVITFTFLVCFCFCCIVHYRAGLLAGCYLLKGLPTTFTTVRYDLQSYIYSSKSSIVSCPWLGYLPGCWKWTWSHQAGLGEAGRRGARLAITDAFLFGKIVDYKLEEIPMVFRF